MKISGLQKLTLLDFPKHTACTVFLPGCNFRCHYCHNPELVLPEKIRESSENFLDESEFFAFLEKRKGLLDGVCVTGGEPTVHPDLILFLEKIKKMGFLVKLDSNGGNSEILKNILEKKIVSYVAMDMKSSLEKYSEFTNLKVDIENIKKSRDLLMNSNIEYEFRTTLVKEFHTEEEFQNILNFLKGAKKYFLQNFRGGEGCINPNWESCSGFTEKELQKMKKLALGYVESCEIRM